MDGRFYLLYTRRLDAPSAGLSYTEQFSRAMVMFEDNVVPATVVATGIGDNGVAIEVVQAEFPAVLPVSGGKARFGQVETGIAP